MISKLIGMFKPGRKILKKGYSEWKYPLKQQRDLRTSFAKNVKNPKWRAKTKLIEYSKKFI